MCNCFAEVLEKVSERILSKAPDFVEGSFEYSWENQQYILTKKEMNLGATVAMPVKYMFRRIKTNGKHYDRPTKSTIDVFPTFCAFCGEKLEK